MRELESVIAAAVCVADDRAETLEYNNVAGRLGCLEKSDADNCKTAGDDVPPAEQGALADMVSGYEKKLIKRAMEEAGGNISKAAQILSVPRQTLSRKVRDYGL